MSSSTAAAERINEKLLSSSKTPSPSHFPAGAPVLSAYATSAESVILPAPSVSFPVRVLYMENFRLNIPSHIKFPILPIVLHTIPQLSAQRRRPRA